MNWRWERSYRHIEGSILRVIGERKCYEGFRCIKKRVISRNFTKSHCWNNGPDCLIIGGLAMDITMRFDNGRGNTIEKLLFTSSPATSSANIGGVAHNVCQAAHYYGQCTPRLVSRVGYDFNLESLAKMMPDLSGIQTDMSVPTSKYIGFNDEDGDLIIAAADMRTIQGMSSKYATEQIRKAQDSLSWICIDGNLSSDTARAIIGMAKTIDCPIMFEPTSVPRARAVANMLSAMSSSSPLITAITPNRYELDAIFQEMHAQNKLLGGRKFNEYPTGKAPDNLIPKKIPDYDLLIHQLGYVLCYIPNIFLKLGKYGVLYATVDYSAFNRFSPSRSNINKQQDLSMEFHYFPALSLAKIKNLTESLSYSVEEPTSDQDLDISVSERLVQNVSGAGDSFAGVLLAQLCQSYSTKSSTATDYTALSRVINTAQAAACLTLFGDQTVSSHIEFLKYQKDI